MKAKRFVGKDEINNSLKPTISAKPSNLGKRPRDVLDEIKIAATKSDP